MDNQTNPKKVFPYLANRDLPRFDPAVDLPKRVTPSSRLTANTGLYAIPARKAPAPINQIGIAGITEFLQLIPSILP